MPALIPAVASMMNGRAMSVSSSANVLEAGMPMPIDDEFGGEVGERRAEHEHVGMGEVDEFEDAVDEGVADRDERDDQAVRDADGQRLDQLLQRPLLIVAEVVDGRPAVRRMPNGRLVLPLRWSGATR